MLLVVLVGTTASSCFDDAARVAARGSDDGLRAGVLLGDEAVEVAPDLGTQLRSTARSLSDNEDVGEASYGLAWDVMCDVVAHDLPQDLTEIVEYVVAGAASFSLEFTDEGAQQLGEAILDELDGEESEILDACAELQP